MFELVAVDNNESLVNRRGYASWNAWISGRWMQRDRERPGERASFFFLPPWSGPSQFPDRERMFWSKRSRERRQPENTKPSHPVQCPLGQSSICDEDSSRVDFWGSKVAVRPNSLSLASASSDVPKSQARCL